MLRSRLGHFAANASFDRALETAIRRLEKASGYVVAGRDSVLHGAGRDCRRFRRAIDQEALPSRRGQPGEYGIVGSLPLAPMRALCKRPGTSTG